MDDLAVILEIGDALTKEDAGKHAEAFNLDWIAQEGEAAYTRILGDERHVVTLAEVDGRAIGYLSGAVRGPSAWRTVPMAEIFALYVIPEYRSQGVGERLIRSFLPWAREQGAERIVVAAFAANEAALRFYRRVGFAPFEVMLDQPAQAVPGDRDPLRKAGGDLSCAAHPRRDPALAAGLKTGPRRRHSQSRFGVGSADPTPGGTRVTCPSEGTVR